MSRQDQKFVLPASPVLMTESADDLLRIRAEFNAAISTRGIIEEIYANDYVDLTWEIIRYRRFKAAIINSGFASALKDLLQEILNKMGYELADAVESSSQQGLEIYSRLSSLPSHAARANVPATD